MPLERQDTLSNSFNYVRRMSETNSWDTELKSSVKIAFHFIKWHGSDETDRFYQPYIIHKSIDQYWWFDSNKSKNQKKIDR